MGRALIGCYNQVGIILVVSDNFRGVEDSAIYNIVRNVEKPRYVLAVPV